MSPIEKRFSRYSDRIDLTPGAFVAAGRTKALSAKPRMMRIGRFKNDERLAEGRYAGKL